MNKSLYIKGKKYISASRAAGLVGYTSDYVGQLCRAKKIEATSIGRNWYVLESSILKHKEETQLETHGLKSRNRAQRLKIGKSKVFKPSKIFKSKSENTPLSVLIEEVKNAKSEYFAKTQIGTNKLSYPKVKYIKEKPKANTSFLPVLSKNSLKEIPKENKDLIFKLPVPVKTPYNFKKLKIVSSAIAVILFLLVATDKANLSVASRKLWNNYDSSALALSSFVDGWNTVKSTVGKILSPWFGKQNPNEKIGEDTLAPNSPSTIVINQTSPASGKAQTVYVPSSDKSYVSYVDQKIDQLRNYFDINLSAGLAEKVDRSFLSFQNDAIVDLIGSRSSGGSSSSIDLSNLSASSPISYDSGTGAFSFDFSTSNTWTGLNQFSNASTTLLSSVYASSTTYFGAGLTDCDDSVNSKLLWSNTGFFSCGADSTGGAGSVDGVGVTNALTSWLDSNTITATGTLHALYVPAIIGTTTQTSSLAGALNVSGLLSSTYSSSTIYSSFLNASTTNLIVNGQSINNLAGIGLTIAGNALTSTLGTSIDISSESNLTAGDGLTLTDDDLDCDTANGSTFGCLSSTDWNTFNNKLGSYDAWTHPGVGISATTSLIRLFGQASSTLISGNFAEFGGTATTTLTNDGKLGVGTTSPAARLSVNSVAGDNFSFWVGSTSAPWLKVSNTGFGTTTVSGFNVVGSATSTSNVGFNITNGCYAIGGNCISGSGSSNNPGGTGTELQFRGGASTFSAVTGSAYNSSLGTLGIGTTTPQYLLNLASSTAPQLALQGADTDAPWTFRSIGGALYIATSSPTTFATSTLSALTISNSGSVGIRHSSPFYALDVVGKNDIVARFVGPTANSGISIEARGDSAASYISFDNESNSNSWVQSAYGPNNSNPRLGFLNGIDDLDSTEKFTMSNTGYFGVATTTPKYPLNPFSNTGSQLALSAGAGINQIAFRNAGGNLYISTTTVDGTATTSISLLEIASNGFGTTTIRGLAISGAQATSTSNVGFNITNGCYAIGGNCLSSSGGSGITALGSGYASTSNTTVTFSTSTLSFNGLTVGQNIVPTAGALTFTPTITGTLDNTGLTNSTISGIALGANLADLTATNGTLTFSGAYNGGTARTIGLNLANANTWSALQTFNYSSSTIYSSFVKASSTNYFGAGLTDCDDGVNSKLLWSDTGFFSCGSDSTGGAGAVDGTGVANGLASWVDSNTITATGTVHALYVPAIIGTTTQASSLGGALTVSGLLSSGYSSSTIYSSFATASTTNLIINGQSVNNLAGTGLTITGNALTATLGTSIDISAETNLTAGDGLTLTDDDLDCDTANGSTFGCLSSTDWNTFNNKLGSYDAWTHPLLGLSATTSQLLIGTSTASNYQLTVSSSTAPQLSLSAGTGLSQWAFRNAGGNLYLGTTTVAGGATTSISALEISGSGFGTTTIRGLAISGAQATSTSNVGFNITNGCYAIGGNCIGGASSSASTTLLGDFNTFTNTNNFTGKLGLATSTPWAKLSVNSIAGEPAFVVGSSTRTDFIVDLSGNVGIGTTTPTLGKFSIGGTDGAIIMGRNSDGYNVISLNGRGLDSTPGNFNFLSSYSDASLYINRPTSGGIYFKEGNSSADLGIAPGGNIGIGTFVPGSRLAVSGNTAIGASYATIAAPTNGAIIQGYVGIGTTTPAFQLQVSSTTASATFKPQLALSDFSAAANSKHWTFASEGGNLYLSTSTDLYATSSIAALSISGSGFGTTTIRGLAISGAQATSTSNVGFNISGGCYAISNTCLSTSGGTSASSTLLGDFNTFTNTNNFTGKLGLATSTPWAKLSVNSIGGEPAFVVGSSTATSFIVDKNGNVGIGTSNPAYLLSVAGNTYMTGHAGIGAQSTINELGRKIVLQVQENIDTNSGDSLGIGIYSNITADPSADGTSAVSIRGFIDNGDRDFSSMIGGDFLASNDAESTVDNLYGVKGVVVTSDADAVTSAAYGGYFQTQTIAGLTTEASGLVTDLYNEAVIGTSYGLRVKSPLNFGTISTNYGIKIEDQTAATINYALLTGLGKVSFGDKVGIGTTTPYYDLTVASTTGSQLALSAGSGLAQVAFRNDGTNFYIASTTVSGTATTSRSALEIALGGFGTTTVRGLNISGAQATSTSNVGFNISGGCYAIGNTCLSSSSGSGLTSYDAWTHPLSGLSATTSQLLIGTSTASNYQLTVSSSTAPQLSLSAGVGLSQWTFRNAGGNLYFSTTTVAGTATTSTSALTVLGASGALGIGTTNPIEVNANSKLTAAGLGAVDIIASSTDNTTSSTAILEAYAPGSRVFLGAHGTNQNTSQYGITVGGWGEVGAIDSSFGTSNGLMIGTRTTATPIVFGTNSLERMRILSTGMIGIATSTPWAKLSVGNYNSSTQFPLFVVASSSAAVSTTTHFVINWNGNVGIATSTPSRPFSVVGNSYFDGKIGIVGTNNNLGVGTADPDYPIHVKSNAGDVMALAQTNGSANVFVKFQNSSNADTAYMGYLTSVSRFDLGTSGANPVSLSTNSTARLTVSGTGSVGIGTTTPYYGLTVASTTGPQISLSAGAGLAQWALANEGGNFYLGTTTVAGTATTSLSALEISGSGFGTTTVRGLNIANAQATSTSNVGFNITNGCYAISGTCVGGAAAGGSGTVNSGVFGQLAFYGANGTTISGTSTITVSTTTSTARVGIATTTGFNATLTLQGAVGLDIMNIASSTGATVLTVSEYGGFVQNISSSTAVIIKDGSGSSVFTVDTTQSAANSGIDITAGASQTGNLLGMYSSASAFLSGFNSVGGLIIGTSSASTKFAVATSSASYDSTIEVSYNSAGATTTIGFFVSTTTGLTTGSGISLPSALRNYMIVGNGKIQASMAVVNGGICVDNDGWCTASTTGRISSVTSTTGGSDVAEIYNSESSLEPGDVVAIASPRNFVKIADATQGEIVLGIVSTEPGVILGLQPDANDKKGIVQDVQTDGEVDRVITNEKTVNKYPIALAGRVPVKVSIENGPIEVGDYLTLSSTTPGTAMKATGAGMVLGQALEGYSDNSPGRILLFVKNFYYAGNNSNVASNSNTNNEETDNTQLSLDFGLGKKIISLFDSLGIRIMQGIAYFKDLFVDRLTVGSAEKPSGITIYDETTKEPFCIKVNNGSLLSTAGACSITQVVETPPVDPISTSTPPVDLPDTSTSTPEVIEGGSATTTPPTVEPDPLVVSDELDDIVTSNTE